MLKLKRTYENLEEVELILREIEPRLRTLKRAITRLEQRQEVEKELQTLQWNYYGRLWSELMTSAKAIRLDFEGAKQTSHQRRAAGGTRGQIRNYCQSRGLHQRRIYLWRRRATKQVPPTATPAFDAPRSRICRAKEIELAKVRAQSSWAPLPCRRSSMKSKPCWRKKFDQLVRPG